MKALILLLTVVSIASALDLPGLIELLKKGEATKLLVPEPVEHKICIKHEDGTMTCKGAEDLDDESPISNCVKTEKGVICKLVKVTGNAKKFEQGGLVHTNCDLTNHGLRCTFNKKEPHSLKQIVEPLCENNDGEMKDCVVEYPVPDTVKVVINGRESVRRFLESVFKKHMPKGLDVPSFRLHLSPENLASLLSEGIGEVVLDDGRVIVSHRGELLRKFITETIKDTFGDEGLTIKGIQISSDQLIELLLHGIDQIVIEEADFKVLPPNEKGMRIEPLDQDNPVHRGPGPELPLYEEIIYQIEKTEAALSYMKELYAKLLKTGCVRYCRHKLPTIE